MKKIILLAAFGVAGMVSAKSAVENKPENKAKTETAEKEQPSQTCGVTVTYYNANGQYSGTGYYSSDQPTLEACMSWQSAKIRSLRLQGYSVSMNTDVN